MSCASSRPCSTVIVDMPAGLSPTPTSTGLLVAITVVMADQQAGCSCVLHNLCGSC